MLLFFLAVCVMELCLFPVIVWEQLIGLGVGEGGWFKARLESGWTSPNIWDALAPKSAGARFSVRKKKRVTKHADVRHTHSPTRRPLGGKFMSVSETDCLTRGYQSFPPQL